MDITRHQEPLKTPSNLALSFRYFKLINLQSNRVHFATITQIIRFVEVGTRPSPTKVHELVVLGGLHAITYDPITAARVGLRLAIAAFRLVLTVRLYDSEGCC
jgi:hypothetical protein